MNLGWRICIVVCGLVTAVQAADPQQFYLELQPSGRRLGPFDFEEGAEVQLGKALFHVVPLPAAPAEGVPAAPAVPAYDGISLGDSMDDVVRKLIWVQGIRTSATGVPYFRQSKGKPFFEYQVNRSRNFQHDPSDVYVFFKDGEVDMIQDTFSGDWMWKPEDARAEFERKKAKFTQVWGAPAEEREGFAEWLKQNVVAVLRLEEPHDVQDSPVLKFGIRRK